MNTAIRLFAITTILAAAAATAPAALAQTDGTQRSRADVKQETLAAMQAGEIVRGEGTPTERETVAASSRTRAERKAETMQARSRGDLVHGGIATYRASISQQSASTHSTKTRAERKAETMEAVKQNQLMKAGEAA